MKSMFPRINAKYQLIARRPDDAKAQRLQNSMLFESAVASQDFFGAGRWVQHTPYHFSYPMPTGDSLQFWPGPVKWQWDGQTMYGNHVSNVLAYIAEVEEALAKTPEDLEDVEDTDVEALVEAFEEACITRSWKGSRDPSLWDDIELDYVAAKTALMAELNK